MAEVQIRPKDMDRAVVEFDDARLDPKNTRACQGVLEAECKARKWNPARYRIFVRKDDRSPWNRYTL